CGPCFPQLSVAAKLSYPAGFSDKRRPQFLRSASPQMGAAAAPIRGHASRCNSNAANRLRFPDSVFFLLFSIFTDGRLLSQILCILSDTLESIWSSSVGYGWLPHSSPLRSGL